jgi:hypothetical protein
MNQSLPVASVAVSSTQHNTMTSAETSQTVTSSSDAKGETASSFENVPWPVRPSPGINYNFVTILYFSGTIIAIFFYLLEKRILDPLLAGDDQKSNGTPPAEGEDAGGGDAWKEFAGGMVGMHFIFDPFIPCLFWSLVVRHYWLKEIDLASQEKKDN